MIEFKIRVTLTDGTTFISNSDYDPQYAVEEAHRYCREGYEQYFNDGSHYAIIYPPHVIAKIEVLEIDTSQYIQAIISKRREF